MMETNLVLTADGSHSIYLPALNEHYHSVHGAIQESLYVFIYQGLESFFQNPLNLLEIGWGTGLNTLLTLLHSRQHNITINYTALEKFPLPADVYSVLNYPELLKCNKREFIQIHEAIWEIPVFISSGFYLTKHQASLQEWVSDQPYHLIYFDAFAPEKQPEMWTEEVFLKLFQLLEQGGALVTYCAKGVVKRTMKSCGFEVQTLSGPPGKREMTRAIKPFRSIY